MTTGPKEPADPTRPDDGAEAWQTPQGLVRVSVPTSAVEYYRITWVDSNGTRAQTTAGRVFVKAWAKALAREADLLRGATPRSEKHLDEGINYWLDPNRPTPRGGWGDSHRHNMTAYARTYFRPQFGQLRCLDLRRSHIQVSVNAGPTASEGRNIRRAAASLIGALRQGDYLLDSQIIDLSNVFWHGTDASTRIEAMSGEDAAFIATWSRPSTAQVKSLRIAAEQTGRSQQHRWWRGLMVELAAFSGPRWSELIAVDAKAVDPSRRSIQVHWRVAEAAGKARRLAPPKMAKRRTTIYPDVSPTGYPIAESIERRLLEVEREALAGWNRKRLLFPNTQGDWWWSGNFHRDFFEKAAFKAGWHYADEQRPYAGTTRTERTWALTWHSLRHTFCTVALEEWKLPESTVAMLAGHSDPNFTRSRYVGAADDALDKAIAATALLD